MPIPTKACKDRRRDTYWRHTVDPDGALSDQERDRRAAEAKSAYFRTLGLRSVAARDAKGVPVDRDLLRRIRVEKIGRRELLAIQAGTTVGMISAIEHGRRNPSPGMLERIAAALRVTPAELAL